MSLLDVDLYMRQETDEKTVEMGKSGDGDDAFWVVSITRWMEPTASHIHDKYSDAVQDFEYERTPGVSVEYF